jgi:hypothetical protein
MEADFQDKIPTGTSKFQNSIISEQYESCGEASRSQRYRPTLLGYTPPDEGPGSIPISADKSKNQLKCILFSTVLLDTALIQKHFPFI